MWLSHLSFKESFLAWWNEISGQEWEGFKFMQKLKGVKDRVKVWNNKISGDIQTKKDSVHHEINSLDKLEEEEGRMNRVQRSELSTCQTNTLSF